MEDNVLQDIENALDKLTELLGREDVRTALGAIPDSILNPVVDGLKSILNVIKDALDELKENLDSVVNLDELFNTISSLLEAAEGLAPGQKETLDTVGNIVKTLQDLPTLEDINRILGKIGQIVTTLDGL